MKLHEYGILSPFNLPISSPICATKTVKFDRVFLPSQFGLINKMKRSFFHKAVYQTPGRQPYHIKIDSSIFCNQRYHFPHNR